VTVSDPKSEPSWLETIESEQPGITALPVVRQVAALAPDDWRKPFLERLIMTPVQDAASRFTLRLTPSSIAIEKTS
jgi:hypothetical protein